MARRTSPKGLGAALLGVTVFSLMLAGFGLVERRASASAQDWPTVRQSTLDKFLFSGQDGSGGQRLARWESDMVLDFYYAKGKAYVREVVAMINKRGLMGGHKVHMLPPATSQGTALTDPFNFAVGVSSDVFNLALQPRPELGTAAYQSHARQSGCFAHPAGRNYKSHIISSGRIMTRQDLSKEALRDCILRGLLLTAGLGHTREMAFRSSPLSEAEREDAFKVLQLVYHPRVRPGMTRAEFTQALRSEGLIVD